MKRSQSMLGLGLLVAIGYTQSAMAQVSADGTVGTIVSTGPIFNISGGTRPSNGPNLFHSFSQFSLPAGSSAIFQNDPTVQTIFSRVTGGSRSDINGTIQAQGNASLFLMNPAGIVFGPKAKLELGGSFVGTTASSLKFEEGVEFSAANFTANPLLTVKLPIGLQMGNNPAAITVQGLGNAPKLDNIAPPNLSNPSGLQVKTGRTLALLGGDVTFAGGEVGGGNVELGSIRDAATVKIVPTVAGFTFSYDTVPTFGNIHLAQQSLITVGSGSLQIQGKTVRFTEGSMAIARNLGSQTGGSLRVHATDRLELGGTTADGTGRSGILSEAFGTGIGSPFVISTGQLILRDGAVLGTRTFSSVTSGSIQVNARDSVLLQGFQLGNPSAVSVIAAVSFASGTAGNVTLNTPRLSLQEGGSLSSLNFGTGRGGDIQVNTHTTEVVGSSPTFSNSGITTTNIGTGSAGTVTLNTGRLRIADGGAILATSINKGLGGNVTIRASESIAVMGDFSGLPSRISSSVSPAPLVFQQLYGLPALPDGQAGNVTITTPWLSVTDGALVSVENLGFGDAGELQIKADVINLDRGGTLAAATLTGSGGNIDIQSQVLTLRHLSQITATASGTKKGGNITIDSPIIIGLENSDIVANAFQGRGGDINIIVQDIIGLNFRNTLTPRTDLTNDITASSEANINGNVNINTIGIVPNAELVSLPVDLTEASRQMSDRCASAKTASFVSTGRGGIPQNPIKTRTSDRPWNDLRSFTAANPTFIQPIAATQPIPTIVEASAIEIDETGAIALVIPKPIESPSAGTCGMTNGAIGP
jgi:filamentous hemagglutinin family protein